MPEINPIYSQFQQQPQINNTPQPTKQTPPVETKTIDKKKLAVGIAAAVGITALVVGGILHKRKVDSKAVKQLAENIKFQQFDTLDDAINFGKQHLGIKKYKGFKQGDVDVVNWINEGLVNVNNASKGKAIMPKKIVYAKLGKITSDGAGTTGAVNGFGTLKISKEYVRSLKKDLLEVLKDWSGGQKAIDKLQKSKNFKDWRNCQIGIMKCFPDVFTQDKVVSHISTFDTIYHEMGHLQHYSSPNYSYERLNGELTKLLKKNTDLAKKVSPYAATDPYEYVAECYAKMVDGKLFGKKLLSDKAFELYKKMGGPVF